MLVIQMLTSFNRFLSPDHPVLHQTADPQSASAFPPTPPPSHPSCLLGFFLFTSSFSPSSPWPLWTAVSSLVTPSRAKWACLATPASRWSMAQWSFWVFPKDTKEHRFVDSSRICPSRDRAEVAHKKKIPHSLGQKPMNAPNCSSVGTSAPSVLPETLRSTTSAYYSHHH